MKVRFASRMLPDWIDAVPRPRRQNGSCSDRPVRDAETTDLRRVRAGQQEGVPEREPRPATRGPGSSLDPPRRSRRCSPRREGRRRRDPRPPTKYTCRPCVRVRSPALEVLDNVDREGPSALAKLDGGEVLIGSRTLDDKTWIVATRPSSTRAGSTSVDRAKQKGPSCFAAQPELEKQPLVRCGRSSIKSRDGLTLVSYLSLPASADPDGDGKRTRRADGAVRALWPVARDLWGYNPVPQMLANRATPC